MDHGPSVDVITEMHQQRTRARHAPDLRMKCFEKICSPVDVAYGKGLAQRVGRRFLPLPSFNVDEAEIQQTYPAISKTTKYWIGHLTVAGTMIIHVDEKPL
jgi:hypothetical protein